MQEKRRTPRGSAMDGFVRRSNPQKNRRASLDSSKSARRKGAFDGFVPRHEDSSKPISVDEKSEWSEDKNTLTIDSQELGGAEEPDINKKKKRWWNKRKKDRDSKASPDKKKKLVKKILLAFVILGLLVGAFLGWKVLKNTSKIFDGNVLGFLENTKLKGEESGRVNILLSGTSEDDPGHQGATLTDSIMLVSVDTINNSAFMTSIPRDLWVGYETRECSIGFQGKINSVYTCGEEIGFKETGYPDGGMGLLQKVVETNFGLDVNYYAKINYTAFEEAVDAVGGIEINLKTDDPRGILDRIFDWECNYRCYKVKYENGPLKLNGEQALDLARARGNAAPTYGAGNDFGRTERQRQMLIAVKDKALSIGILTNPAKISSLLDTAGNNVDTDFQTNELRRLYEIGKNIDSKNIKSIGLTDDDVNLVETFQAFNGASAVRPTAGTDNFTQIKQFFKKLTSSDPIVREGAEVAVLNASGMVGLAQKNADILSKKGLKVVSVGNAEARTTNVIVDKSKGLKNNTKKYLEKQFNATFVSDPSSIPEASNYQADFIVVFGKSSQDPSAN